MTDRWSDIIIMA